MDPPLRLPFASDFSPRNRMCFRSALREGSVYSPACHTHWHYLPADICLLSRTIRQSRSSTQPPAATRLTEAFAASGAQGLEILESGFLREPLTPTFGFWRGLARRYFTALCHHPNLDAADLTVAKPAENDWIALVGTAPPMKGLEYLNGLVVARLWDELDAHVHAAIARTSGGAAADLKNCNPLWNAVGRVTFHVAENKRSPAHPFAFLATYTNRVSEQGKVQHLPLGRAL